MNLNINQILIISLSILLFYIVYINFSKQKENLTETSDNKDKLANDILNFLKSDTEYKDYLAFLTTIPYNLSIKLLEQEVFYEMKYNLKNNKLNKEEIKKFITDM